MNEKFSIISNMYLTLLHILKRDTSFAALFWSEEMIRKDLEVVVVRMYFHFGSEIEKIFFKNQFGFTYYKPLQTYSFPIPPE